MIAVTVYDFHGATIAFSLVDLILRSELDCIC